MTDIRTRIRHQMELEDEARALGAARYHSRQLPWKTEAGSIDEEANLPPGRMLVKTCVEPVAAAIEAFIAEACSGKAGRRHNVVDYLLLSDPYETAYLAVRVMTNMSISQSLLQTVAIGVTDAIIENLEFKAFKDMNKKGYKGYLKQQEARGFSRQRRAAVRKLFESEGVRMAVSEGEKVSIGLKLIELAIEATGLFVSEPIKRKKGYSYHLKPTETLQGWMDNQHARCSTLEPINMPMLVRPRRWRSPNYGGYLTPRPGNRFVKQRNKAYHIELRNIDIERVYASVKGRRIDTHWCGQRLAILIQIDDEKIDSRSQANGVAPNFVHSLDAAHLQAVAKRCREEGIMHLAMIHDSFPRTAIYKGKEVVVTKNGKPRDIPLTAHVLAILPALKECSEGARWFPWALGSSGPLYLLQKVRADMAEKGYAFDNVVLHTMRHTCATRLAEGGFDLVGLRDFLGHSDIKITAGTYLHMMNGHVFRAAAILDIHNGTVGTDQGKQEDDGANSSSVDHLPCGTDRAESATAHLH